MADDINKEQTRDRSSSTVGDALKTGAMIGGGLLAYRNRRFLGQQVRRLGGGAMHVAGTSYTHLARGVLTNQKLADNIGRYKRLGIALGDGLGPQTGVMRATHNLLRPRQTGFDSRFNASMERQLANKSKKNVDPVHQNATKMSKYYMNNIHMKTGEAHNQAFGFVQQRQVQKNIERKMKDYHEQGLHEMLVKYSNENGSGIYSSPTEDKVIDFVREFTGKGAQEKYNKTLQFKGATQADKEMEASKFTKELNEILKNHQDKTRNGMKPFQQEIEQYQKNIEKIQRESFLKAFSPESNENIQSRLFAKQGLKQLTFEDYRKHGFEIDNMKIPLPGGKHKEENMIDMIQQEYGSKMDLNKLVVDPNIYIDKKGKLLDMRDHNEGMFKAASTFQDVFQTPFLRFNPLDLAHFTTIRSLKEMPEMAYLGAGETHGFVRNVSRFAQNIESKNATAKFTPLSRGGYMYSEGSVFDITTGAKVDEGMYLGSSAFGPLSRMHTGMGNIKERADDNRGFVKELFDVGGQQQDSFWQSMKGAIEKFDDPLYGPNIQSSVKQAKQDPFLTKEDRLAFTKKAYGHMYGSMEKNAMSLSPEAIDYMAGAMNDGFRRGGMSVDIRELYRGEDIMNALGEIVQKTSGKPSPNVFYSTGKLPKGNKEADGLIEQIHDTWKRYVNDPRGFLNSKDMEPDKSIVLPDSISPIQLHEQSLVPSTERVRRLIQQYGMKQMEVGTDQFNLARNLVDAGYTEGVLTRKDKAVVRQLDTLSEVRNYHNRIYSGDSKLEESGLDMFAKDITENPSFANDVQTTMKEFQPYYAAKPEESYGAVTGSNTTLYRKRTSYRDRLQEINERYKAEGKLEDGITTAQAHLEGLWGTAREMFAGRKNPYEVTTLTAFPYYYAERLDNAVSGLGLGLSQWHRGSFASILGNQFARRIAMPYMVYQQAMYLDGLTGDTVSDKAADTYVNMHEGLNDFKEMTGINRVMRSWSKVFAGSDQIAELPGIQQFNFLTMGAFSDWRSGEDLEKYYESGEDEIRKSRYWGVGSSTPWSGGGIEYFRPNWYRRLKSDYKFTDTMYGDESEYWANHWMPTLTHPFAPIKHYFLDPYHYEEKHKKDRPYAITGGFSEIEQVPIIGPAANKVIGGILKPRQENGNLDKAHRKYLEEMNAGIAQRYNELADGQFVTVGAAGGVNVFEQPKMGGSGGLSGGTEAEQEIDALMDTGEDEDGVGFGGFGGTGTVSSIATIGSGQGAPVSVSFGGNAGSGFTGEKINMSSMALLDLASKNAITTAGGLGAQATQLDRYTKLTDPFMTSDSADITTVDNASGLVRDAFYSASEIGGIYGFGVKTAMGFEESGRGQVWAPSTLMTSYSRSFWDLSLGGAGGQLSEIGRRYVPRDPNKQYYSPLENEMPDWMPGMEYFTDFQHGDPYAKIKQGEMRLPGEAYETLYKLHPDGTGTGEYASYGALDRYRILADTAMYSNQYKAAKAMVSKMSQAGLLTDEEKDEAKEIREQVSARKDKYRWYNKKFSNAEINKETVHVTEIIDQNTFLTKEYGNNPIRMAGVKLSQDDTDAVEWLQQFIKPGATLKIGLDADPVKRVNRDTLNTMSAVVYAPHAEEGGSVFYGTSKGQSLNYVLANRKWENSDVRVSDKDGSVVTNALYTNDMRFVGGIWEKLTHDILPQIPIAGVFADKFLQVRSPIESYERDQVYGKEWKPWTEPIQSWIKPMIDTIATRNPLVATAEGAGIGHLFTKSEYRGRGRIVGAVMGAAVSSLRVFNEEAKQLMGNDRRWIPERREKEREINEYFDRLKYVKYHGLYEKARRMAMIKEGVDVEDFFNKAQEKGQENKGLRKYIAEKKKWLSIAQKSGYGDDKAIESQLDELGQSKKSIDEDKAIYHTGPIASLAIQYRKEYEATLYGLDPKSSDLRDVLRALTPKDRKYMAEFMNTTNGKERERILSVVSNDNRRILQAKWGMQVDKKEEIGEYFQNHYLPGANWEGWSTNASLDNVKIKVMRNEGVELTESGFWQEDEKRADNSGLDALPMNNISSRLDIGRLEEVLRGAGLNDVKVMMSVGQNQGGHKVNTVLNIMKDRKNEITGELNNQLQSILSGG